MKSTLGLILIVVLIAGCQYIQTNPNPTDQNLPAPTVGPQTQPTQVQPASTGKCQSKLTGRVLDANGAPAKGATIDIRGGGRNFTTISDDNGLYGFAGLCAGTYNFRVTLQGQPAKDVAGTAQLDGSNTARTDLAVK